MGVLAQPVEDYRSTIKSRLKETIMSCILFLTVDLKPIIHSEVSQKEKHQYSVLNAYTGNLERW